MDVQTLRDEVAAGRIDTVGADSVFEWLQRSALAQAPRLVP